jgi:hypothetical protein
MLAKITDNLYVNPAKIRRVELNPPNKETGDVMWLVDVAIDGLVGTETVDEFYTEEEAREAMKEVISSIDAAAKALEPNKDEGEQEPCDVCGKYPRYPHKAICGLCYGLPPETLHIAERITNLENDVGALIRNTEELRLLLRPEALAEAVEKHIRTSPHSRALFGIGKSKRE